MKTIDFFLVEYIGNLHNNYIESYYFVIIELKQKDCDRPDIYLI